MLFGEPSRLFQMVSIANVGICFELAKGNGESFRLEPHLCMEKSEYAVTSNELKNQFDIPIQLFLSCIGYQ